MTNTTKPERAFAIQYEGRDMDTAVAKLLGYTFMTFPGGPCPLTEHWSKPGAADPCGFAPPPFSTDIGTAWKIVERWRDYGHGVEILDNPGHSRCRVNYGETVSAIAEARHVPLAICKAFIAMSATSPAAVDK